MINKQKLWFLTLFSLILVLSVYYITMPNELLITTNGNYLDKDKTTQTSGGENNVKDKEEAKEPLQISL